jgi:glyoxylase-like metal-dependent hydrolase (beta-lactamase superfamily II)
MTAAARDPLPTEALDHAIAAAGSAERGGLVYPHGAHVPADGALLEVAPGVFWLRMPLPFSLDHINLWILDGGDHWALVDTGLPSPVSKKHWRALFAGPLSDKPVGRIIVTHYHPDHIGLAGWLAAKWQVTLEMSRSEFMLARTLTLDVAERTPDDVVRFYAMQGWPADAVDRLKIQRLGAFRPRCPQIADGLSPAAGRRQADDRRPSVGQSSWVPATARSMSACSMPKPGC